MDLCTLVQNIKYVRTIDQELVDAAAEAPGRRFVFTHQAAALLCVK